MAIEEHDREDLLRDGQTMILRGECLIEGIHVLVGFRRGGQVSVYVDQDPVFQFNGAGELRRAFFRGRRFASESRKLYELIRHTKGGNVKLQRRAVDVEMATQFAASWNLWKTRLSAATTGSYASWRVVGGDTQVFCERVAQWLHEQTSALALAEAPNA